MSESPVGLLRNAFKDSPRDDLFNCVAYEMESPRGKSWITFAGAIFCSGEVHCLSASKSRVSKVWLFCNLIHSV